MLAGCTSNKVVFCWVWDSVVSSCLSFLCCELDFILSLSR